MNDLNENGLRLFVIDDEKGITDFIEHVADEEGFLTTSINDPSEIRAAWSAGQPNLLFLDLNMPGIDGIETLHLLAELNCTAKIFIISGMDASMLNSAKEIGEQCNLDIAGTLKKPFRYEDVEGILKSAQESAEEPVSTSLNAVLGNGKVKIYFSPIKSTEEDATPHPASFEVIPFWTNEHGHQLAEDKYLGVIEQNNLEEYYFLELFNDAFKIWNDWQPDNKESGLCFKLDGNIWECLQVPTWLKDIADRWEMPYNKITVAFDQDAIKVNRSAVLAVVTRLKISQFRIAAYCKSSEILEFDDLLSFPVNEVKLVGCDAEKLKNDMELHFNVSTLRSSCKSKDVSTVVAGIDSEREQTIFSEFGFECMQGNHIGKMVSPDKAQAKPAHSSSSPSVGSSHGQPS